MCSLFVHEKAHNSCITLLKKTSKRWYNERFPNLPLLAPSQTHLPRAVACRTWNVDALFIFYKRSPSLLIDKLPPVKGNQQFTVSTIPTGFRDFVHQPSRYLLCINIYTQVWVHVSHSWSPPNGMVPPHAQTHTHNYCVFVALTATSSR